MTIIFIFKIIILKKFIKIEIVSVVVKGNIREVVSIILIIITISIIAIILIIILIRIIILLIIIITQHNNTSIITFKTL
jgi:hypothetical protein